MPAYASAAMPTASSPLAQSSHPGVPHNVNLQPSGGSTSGPGSSPHMQTNFGAQGLVRPGVQPNARPGGDSPSAVTELGNGKPKFYSTRDNLFLHKMAITNKSRVVVLNKKISLFLLCYL
ncbi:uncharacterized protein LOC123884900 [Trifolium pratense]|uniref:uncharacterized protein LOC123884900 n=1 Tax=Trifolium pratense TaxID=57577 RepID=UPI001E693521|nr:uncharacterized protein LOC123884900 [Trifolium pratense]